MFSYWTDLDWDRPLDWMDDFRRRMDRLFEEYEPGATEPSMSFLGRSMAQWPAIQMNDADQELLVTAELPGVAEGDINISIQGDMLTITGKRNIDIPKGYAVHRQERQAFEFTRSFSLPCPVQQDKINAELKNGLLLLKLPKAAEAKPRQISIKAA